MQRAPPGVTTLSLSCLSPCSASHMHAPSVTRHANCCLFPPAPCMLPLYRWRLICCTATSCSKPCCCICTSLQWRTRQRQPPRIPSTTCHVLAKAWPARRACTTSCGRGHVGGACYNGDGDLPPGRHTRTPHTAHHTTHTHPRRACTPAWCGHFSASVPQRQQAREQRRSRLGPGRGGRDRCYRGSLCGTGRRPRHPRGRQGYRRCRRRCPGGCGRSVASLTHTSTHTHTHNTKRARAADGVMAGR